jgi:cytochrome P450
MSLLLAFYPDVQDKIYEELQTVFMTADEEVTDEHLKQLIYMDLVIKEMLRFWPTVPHIARCLSQDMELGKFCSSSFLSISDV